MQVFREFGSPFSNTSNDLISLESGVAFEADSISHLYNIEKLGRDQYVQFCDERLITSKKSLYDPNIEK